MTLTTHAIVGAAAARIFSFNPALAMAAAFLSHFLIDAIPHWDYIPRSFQKDPDNPLNNDMTIGKDFSHDVMIILFDAVLGIVLSLLIFSSHTAYDAGIIVLGAMFGILPDPLQFVYWKVRREPLISLQRFHVWIHANNRHMSDERLWVRGALFQAILIGFVVLLTFYIKGV